MELSDITLFLLATAITLIVYSLMKLLACYNYWKNQGISYLKPLPFFGNLLPVFCYKKSIGDFYHEVYNKFPNENVVGVYETLVPVLIVRDPKIVEKILIKDFQYFTDRPPFAEEKGLFAYGLFQLRGSAWRSMRYKISPAFTSGKLKGMFSGMLECTDEMMAKINANLNKDYELREALSTYMINVIANTVFGIQITNKNTMEEFIRMGTSIFNTKPTKFVETILLFVLPKLAELLGFTFMPEEATTYFKGLIKNTLKQRENVQYERNDYTQQLLKLKQQGAIEVQSKDVDDEEFKLDSAASSENIEISDDMLAGQAFQFLSAGYDPLLIVTMFTLHDIAQHPEVQERARNHIQEVLEKHNGYTYACIQDMTYLEQCIQETLRLHPIITFLFRGCTKKYHLSDVGLQIEKGQKVIIPLGALQMDPKYYPNPEVYNPERFPPSVSRQNFTYLPFGDGPRFCIGFRYAMIVMKLGLTKILSKYKLKLSPKNEAPIEFNKQSLIQMPKKPIWFNITPI
uniref:Putative cytochrome p450 6j1-like isoform 1 n=1 Tax=Panstrongylus megistus TaxID=65343 RepID=A0A069DV74_9HEMI